MNPEDATTLEQLQRIEKQRGYKPGWANHVWDARQAKLQKETMAPSDDLRTYISHYEYEYVPKPKAVGRKLLIFACGMHPQHQHATQGEAEECITRMLPKGEARPKVIVREETVYD